MNLAAIPSMLAQPKIKRQDLAGGGFILSSTEPLGDVTRSVGDWLELWAQRTPNALFLAERGADGEWVKLSYAEVRQKVGGLAQALLDLDLGPRSPIVCLSDAGIDQALLLLAAMYIGRPFSTVSSAYSRLSKDYAKVSAIVQSLAPGVLYASDGAVFGPAIRASQPACPVVLNSKHEEVEGALALDDLLRVQETPAVMQAFAQVTPETHAKYLLTSGSTGLPKVVINTHHMLCVNQKQVQLAWPFLREEKPVLVSWLPWSHTFGTNYNFNIVLANGGSFYFDEGRPAPGLIEKTVRNLREVQPNLLFNIPRGFDALLPFVEGDAAVARDIFGRARVVFYAGAALPQSTWERFESALAKVAGRKVMFASALGSTETSPVATYVHWHSDSPRNIGLPVAQTSLKFVPNGDKLELRFHGPQVFPGYLNDAQKTAEAFDEDGYYKIGDAGVLIDPHRLEMGVAFDGRVAEDFKLVTGTWVSVGVLRVQAVAAMAPHVLDVVITGHDRDEVGLLVFPAPGAAALSAEQLREAVRAGLNRLRAETGGGSSKSPARALLLAEPPSIEAGEITDKGYINQRMVLTRRAESVHRLHQSPTHTDVIIL